MILLVAIKISGAKTRKQMQKAKMQKLVILKLNIASFGKELRALISQAVTQIGV